MNTLEVWKLKKSFGKLSVLDDVTFSARRGTVLGFVGKNGAGKTTTMKVLTGLLAGDGGKICLDGKELAPNLGYKGVPIGYLPDVPSFYGYMKPLEYLLLCGEIMQTDQSDNKRKANELLELVGLEAENKRISKFSRGMKQRLGMAQALMGNPVLLLCDEPTSALDPLGRREILELISRIKEQTTVVFSTHVLTDVEQVCDDVAILDGGRILYCGEMNALKRNSSQAVASLRLTRDADVNDFVQKLENALPGALLKVDGFDLAFGLPLEHEVQKKATELLWRLLRSEELILEHYAIKNPTLEEAFLEVIR